MTFLPFPEIKVVRSQEPGVRSQESGVRSQKSEVRSKKEEGIIFFADFWLLAPDS
jgi:hypothetical protein